MDQYHVARAAIFDAVESVQDNIPDGREKSEAISKLQEGLLWIAAANDRILRRS